MDAPKMIWAKQNYDGEFDGMFVIDGYPLPPSMDSGAFKYILAAEHDRIVAEKDAEIARLREALGAELAATRDNALEDAARMVDCACECRDAVLAAKTKVDRWNACGRDPCGALDAADIRAMKGGEE